jgi:WD40 repeat protein
VDDWSLDRTLEGQPGAVSSVAFSPDGKLLAAAGKSDQVKVWKLSSEDGNATSDTSPVWVLRSPTEGVNSISWSPDSRQLAAALDDHTIQVWEILEP